MFLLFYNEMNIISETVLFQACFHVIFFKVWLRLPFLKKNFICITFYFFGRGMFSVMTGSGYMVLILNKLYLLKIGFMPILLLIDVIHPFCYLKKGRSFSQASK